jgi:hypothetical protein
MARRTGRPPKLTDGRPVSQLEKFTARFTPKTKARLMALAEISGIPAYELLEKAFSEHWNALETEPRRRAEQLIQLKSGQTLGSR